MRRRRRRKGVTADKSTFSLMLLRWDRVMGLLDGRERSTKGKWSRVGHDKSIEKAINIKFLFKLRRYLCMYGQD